MKKLTAFLTILFFLASDVAVFAASDKASKAKDPVPSVSVYVTPVQQHYNDRYQAAKEVLDRLDENILEKAQDKVEKIIDKLEDKVEKLLGNLPSKNQKKEARIEERLEKAVERAVEKVDKVADRLVKRANKIEPAPEPETPPTPPVPNQGPPPQTVDLNSGYLMGPVTTLTNGDKTASFYSTGPGYYYDKVLVTYDALSGQPKSATGLKSFSTTERPDVTGYTLISKTIFDDGSTMSKYVYQDPLTNKTIILYYDSQGIFSSADVMVTESISLSRLLTAPLVL